MARPRIRSSGLLMALLALVAQLALGAAVPDPALPLALHDAAIICHAPTPAEGKVPPAQHRHVPLSQFCPLWTAQTVPSPLLSAAGPLLPAPPLALFHRPALPPPATAPPAAPFRTAQPRGPPALA